MKLTQEQGREQEIPKKLHILWTSETSVTPIHSTWGERTDDEEAMNEWLSGIQEGQTPMSTEGEIDGRQSLHLQNAEKPQELEGQEP